MSTIWTHKIGGKNVHVYGYKVRLHVYKNCVNVAALATTCTDFERVHGPYKRTRTRTRTLI